MPSGSSFDTDEAHFRGDDFAVDACAFLVCRDELFSIMKI